MENLAAGSAVSDHKLTPKEGFFVMVFRSIGPLKGHTNGAFYILKFPHLIRYLRESISALNEETVFSLPKTPRGSRDSKYTLQVFKRTTLSMRVFLAVSVNQAQEQSFSVAVLLDLSDLAFSHGQLYVLLSRVTNLDKLKLGHLPNPDSQAINVVYAESLAWKTRTSKSASSKRSLLHKSLLCYDGLLFMLSQGRYHLVQSDTEPTFFFLLLNEGCVCVCCMSHKAFHRFRLAELHPGVVYLALSKVLKSTEVCLTDWWRRN